MVIVGVSAFFHEAAAAVLVDGALVAASAEERFSRIKHDPRLPVQAYRFCLEAAGVGPDGVDAVAFYESPAKKVDRQRWAGSSPPPGQPDALDPGRPERMIREHLGHAGPILTFDHHLSHAASAYHFSGFDDAAVLTVDGVGEWATTGYHRAVGEHIETIDEVQFPHSLGLLYAAVTSYLGFRVNDGEYKVMGLAPYGEPVLADRVRRLVRSTGGAGFELDMRYFDFVGGEQMYSAAFVDLLGRPPRRPGEAVDGFWADVAASTQLVLEELLLEKVAHLAGLVDSPNLCLAGGVALNCVANGRIRREGPFADVFVPPPAGDDGGSLGAAALAHVALTGERPERRRLAGAAFGPGYGSGEVTAALRSAGLPAEPAGPDTVADRLAAGQVVGWFDGAMEIGPRALGHRSILADPRDAAMRERLNAQVKRREAFRPFAPSVVAGAASAHLDLAWPSPFMLETCQVVSPLPLPAVTHVDGSCRPQTVDPDAEPRFAALLAAFAARTGCPVLLNTSLNVAGEPIACSPADALRTMAVAGLDALVLEGVLVEAGALPARLPELLAAWEPAPRRAVAEGRPGHLYSFV